MSAEVQRLYLITVGLMELYVDSWLTSSMWLVAAGVLFWHQRYDAVIGPRDDTGAPPGG